VEWSKCFSFTSSVYWNLCYFLCLLLHNLTYCNLQALVMAVVVSASSLALTAMAAAKLSSNTLFLDVPIAMKMV
jgi:hypothetical protein